MEFTYFIVCIWGIYMCQDQPHSWEWLLTITSLGKEEQVYSRFIVVAH